MQHEILPCGLNHKHLQYFLYKKTHSTLAMSRFLSIALFRSKVLLKYLSVQWTYKLNIHPGLKCLSFMTNYMGYGSHIQKETTLRLEVCPFECSYIREVGLFKCSHQMYTHTDLLVHDKCVPLI
jgi:hypothetical protein